MAKKASRRAVTFQAKTALNRANEEALKDEYHIGMSAHLKMYNDPPSVPCVSCERLCCKQDVQAVEKLL